MILSGFVLLLCFLTDIESFSSKNGRWASFRKVGIDENDFQDHGCFEKRSLPECGGICLKQSGDCNAFQWINSNCVIGKISESPSVGSKWLYVPYKASDEGYTLQDRESSTVTRPESSDDTTGYSGGTTLTSFSATDQTISSIASTSATSVQDTFFELTTAEATTTLVPSIENSTYSTGSASTSVTPSTTEYDETSSFTTFLLSTDLTTTHNKEKEFDLADTTSNDLSTMTTVSTLDSSTPVSTDATVSSTIDQTVGAISTSSTTTNQVISSDSSTSSFDAIDELTSTQASTTPISSTTSTFAVTLGTLSSAFESTSTTTLTTGDGYSTTDKTSTFSIETESSNSGQTSKPTVTMTDSTTSNIAEEMMTNQESTVASTTSESSVIDEISTSSDTLSKSSLSIQETTFPATSMLEDTTESNPETETTATSLSATSADLSPSSDSLTTLPSTSFGTTSTTSSTICVEGVKEDNWIPFSHHYYYFNEKIQSFHFHRYACPLGMELARWNTQEVLDFILSSSLVYFNGSSIFTSLWNPNFVECTNNTCNHVLKWWPSNEELTSAHVAKSISATSKTKCLIMLSNGTVTSSSCISATGYAVCESICILP